MDTPDCRRMSVEEYTRLPEDPLYRYELDRGRLVREPRPASWHGWIVMKLGHALMQHMDEHRGGYVMTESGFVLATEPQSVRGPALSFVAHDRAPEFPTDGYLNGAPDLAVEVLSRSDRAGPMREKVKDYLASGARLVWLVDPRKRTVTDHRPGAGPRTLDATDTLTGEDVLPGFSLPLGLLFSAWRGRPPSN